MKIPPISIRSLGSLSPLGSTPDFIWKQYLKEAHCLQYRDFDLFSAHISALPEEELQQIQVLRNSDRNYKKLDPSVLYAVYASRLARERAGWGYEDKIGVNVGSSRGATTLFEQYHDHFLRTGHTPTASSPTTTLGNISSWVAHDLGVSGPSLSHSITCSTALHALLNGISWIRAGMTSKCIVGGSEAPLTAFTIAQMKAMKIYASTQQEYPCRAMDMEKHSNGMVLGEGAAVACIEAGISKDSMAVIEGIGYATEALVHGISISDEANCIQKAMKMAMGDLAPSEIDVIVLHAPGTLKGDQAERNAIYEVFGSSTPAMTTNKWKIGHTLGASGMLSVEMAVLMLQYQQFLKVPYVLYRYIPEHIRRVMLNTVGFGGNAVSVLLSSP